MCKVLLLKSVNICVVGLLFVWLMFKFLPLLLFQSWTLPMSALWSDSWTSPLSAWLLSSLLMRRCKWTEPINLHLLVVIDFQLDPDQSKPWQFVSHQVCWGEESALWNWGWCQSQIAKWTLYIKNCCVYIFRTSDGATGLVSTGMD